MLQYFLLPLIGLLLSLGGLFFDIRKNPKSPVTLLFIALMLLSAAATGWMAWQKGLSGQAEAQSAVADKNKVMQSLNDLTAQMGHVNTQVGHVDQTTASLTTQIAQLGEALGIRADKQSPAVLAQGVQAHAAAASLATPAARQGNAGITIQYFPKDLDKDIIPAVLLDNLKAAGFALKSGVGNPALKHAPTNAIWYGAAVPVEAVKLVALTLLQSGVALQAIQKFDDATNPAKTHLIQVGALAVAMQKPAYTVDQINAM